MLRTVTSSEGIKLIENGEIGSSTVNTMDDGTVKVTLHRKSSVLTDEQAIAMLREKQPMVIVSDDSTVQSRLKEMKESFKKSSVFGSR